MKRIIDKQTGIFKRDIRDSEVWDEETEIALEVEPPNNMGFIHPKWEDGQWVEGATEIPTPQVEEVKKDLEQRVATIEETLDVLFEGNI